MTDDILMVLLNPIVDEADFLIRNSSFSFEVAAMSLCKTKQDCFCKGNL